MKMETRDESLDHAIGNEKLKMEPISSDRKKELEKTLKQTVCPLTSEEVLCPLSIGVYLYAGSVHRYVCAIDGVNARGGVNSTSLSLPTLKVQLAYTAERPCNEEYAKNCYLRLRHDGGDGLVHE